MSNIQEQGSTISAIYQVSRSSSSDMGSYLCRAESEAGRSEDVVQIIVQDSNQPFYPPQPERPDRPGKFNFTMSTLINPLLNNVGMGGQRPGGVEVDRREFNAPLGGNAELKCLVVGKYYYFSCIK
jgi:hypothetical protein